jgi:hypothetical protein
VQASQGRDRAIVEQVDALIDETKAKDAEVEQWRERAQSEEAAKLQLRVQLDQLAANGAAAARDYASGTMSVVPDLSLAIEREMEAQEQAGAAVFVMDSDEEDELAATDAAGVGGGQHSLVQTLARTSLMARRLRALAAEVQAEVAPPDR